MCERRQSDVFQDDGIGVSRLWVLVTTAGNAGGLLFQDCRTFPHTLAVLFIVYLAFHSLRLKTKPIASVFQTHLPILAMLQFSR